MSTIWKNGDAFDEFYGHAEANECLEAPNVGTYALMAYVKLSNVCDARITGVQEGAADP